MTRVLAVAAGIALAAPAGAAAAPDPLLAQQWALTNPAAIGAAEAWTQSSGAGALVAVLDTGIQLDHPDLAANVWTNPREVPGNGRDDDADGIVDDVHGANMFDASGRVADDNGHGTHVAGIIAANRGNGVGGAGLAPRATILPVKVLDAAMAGSTDVLARGIRYAADRGARIINVSVNSASAPPDVGAAVADAGRRGAIVVASAGNDGRNIDLLPSYPAALPDRAILSVAAASPSGNLWNLSNTGLIAVDIAAPGEHIVSTALGSSYSMRMGTSAAAPFVSASLALLAAARPDASMGALRDVLLATARHSNLLAALNGGRALDVGAAMHRVLPGAAWKTTPPDDLAAAASLPTLRLRVTSHARVGARVTLRWRATGAERVDRWRVSLDGHVVATLRASRTRLARRIERSGRHRWRVVGLDADGIKLVAARRAMRVG
jgi:subtilisin family serine protease